MTLQSGCRFCGQAIDPHLQAHAIVNEVAEEHHISVEDIYRHTRRSHIVAARACAIRRIRVETDLKLMAIASLFGLDHSTILYHINDNGRRATDAAAVTSRQAQA